ncbi:ComEC/Rec2 family competence protein [Aquimarina agarivorans]|uniref:ComEC/Rec2 family competence protein n=1 Tax=Aquimarina agarivorans TaxID=980584 RepID=UPI000248FCA2|nr:ComEC/Rec2 family competence protein [Aquimarina agarivorans]
MKIKPSLNIPFWVICCAFVLGVFIAQHFINLFITISISVGLITLLALLFFYKKLNSVSFLSIAGVLFLCIGYLRLHIAQPKYQKSHIVHCSSTKTPKNLTFEITKVLKPSKKHQKFKVKIHYMDTKKVLGNALVSVKCDSHVQYYKGDSFTCFSKLHLLKKSNNPYAFEYTDYLKKENITHQFWVTSTDLYQIPPLANSLNKVANTLKKHLVINLKNQHLHPIAYQLTTALVLGNKSEVDNQLATDFTNAGVIHILAISGLHMGIIYLVLAWCFQQVHASIILKSILIIGFLWLFTWFSGGSPSAIRATTMFSCFQLSKLLMRRQHPLNPLFVSIFILVLIDPYTLPSVGFQLSVVAVGSIIVGVPKLLALWKPKFWLTRKVWGIICVSTCAQFGLLPLSVFYFHQFPSLFLLANLPLMLMITLVLITAISIVIWSGIGTIPGIIINGYNYFIMSIYKYIQWISLQKEFLFTELYIQPATLIFLYLFLAFLVVAYHKPLFLIRRGYLILLGLIGLFFYEKTLPLFVDELWVHQHYTNTILTEITSRSINTHSKNTLSTVDKKFLVAPIKGNLHLNSNRFKLKNSYTYKKHQIHIIDNKSSIPTTVANAVVILTDAPKINLQRILSTQKPKLIIATSHNYKNLAQKWKATCAEHQVAFYDISQRGSLNITKELTTP